MDERNRNTTSMMVKLSKHLKPQRALRVYLLGPTGAGKSSAINCIQGKACAEEASGLGKSTTKSVMSYYYEDDDLKLSLYDTPGFPDTEPGDIRDCFNRLVDAEVHGGKTGMNVSGVDAAIFMIKTDNISDLFWEDLSLLSDELKLLSPDVHRFLLVNVVASKFSVEETKQKNGQVCAKNVNGILQWCDPSNIIVSTGFGGSNLGSDIKNALMKVKGSTTKQHLRTFDQILKVYEDAFASQQNALHLIEDQNRQDIEDLEAKIEHLKEYDAWIRVQIERLGYGAALTAGVGILAVPFTAGFSLAALTGAGATEIGRRIQMGNQEANLSELETTKQLLKCAKDRVRQSSKDAHKQAREQGQKFRRLANFVKYDYEFPAWME